MSGVLNLLLAGAASAIKDAYFNLTTLLLNTSSTNGAQNNTFLDSSTNNFTITRNGNTTQGTFTPFSQTGWSNYFGSSNFLTTPSSSAFNLSSGDWTIEGWFWLNTNTDDTRLFTIVNSSTDMYGAFVRSGTVRFGQIGVGDAAFGTVNLNTWNHIAFSKTSTSTVTCYINGVSTGSTTSYTLPNANCTAYIVASPANYALATTNGYVSNFRIVKGTAVYTSAFTPSTTPLTAITNTSLLTCQSNRFVDNSTNTFALTVNGTPSVQAFSPFAPTAAYSDSVVGGSGYFDGTGDYLSIAAQTALNFGTGDFTLEAWVYPTTTLGDATCILTSVSTGGLMFGTNGAAGSGVWAIGRRGTAWDNSSSAIPLLNQWQHVVVCRSGTSVRIFVNGVQSGSTFTNSTSYDLGSGGTLIGYQVGYMNGYFCGVRATNSALYTSNFTPPTAPPTAVTNTQLLLNYTNAGIYDSASKNVLETVGNAQVSTTQAKWGTTAMYFDGSGDYVYLPSNQLLAVGSSGDFTIETWIYPTTGSVRRTLLFIGSTGTTDLNLFIEITAANVLRFLLRNTAVSDYLDISSTTTVSLNTWSHVAIVVSGTTGTIYLNGTSIASGSFSTTRSGAYTTGAVGALLSGGATHYFVGYMDDFRVTKYARYTTTFTPPTAAFPLQ